MAEFPFCSLSFKVLLSFTVAQCHICHDLVGHMSSTEPLLMVLVTAVINTGLLDQCAIKLDSQHESDITTCLWRFTALKLNKAVLYLLVLRLWHIQTVFSCYA